MPTHTLYGLKRTIGRSRKKYNKTGLIDMMTVFNGDEITINNLPGSTEVVCMYKDHNWMGENLEQVERALYNQILEDEQ